MALADWLSLLHEKWPEVLVPAAVWKESASIPSADARRRLEAAREMGWLIVQQAEDRLAVEELEKHLDPGEAEAIVLALETHASWLLIDERKGRAVAREKGLAVTGTLGLLMWAKSAGLVASLAEAFTRIESLGQLYLSADLKAAALQAVGEMPEP